MAWTPPNDHLDPPQHRRRPTPQPRRAESFLWDMFGSVGIVGWVVYLLVAVAIILLGNLIMVVGSYDKFNPPPPRQDGPPPVEDFSAESIVLRNGNDDR